MEQSMIRAHIGWLPLSERYSKASNSDHLLIYVDNEGNWYNRRREVAFVAPGLNVSS